MPKTLGVTLPSLVQIWMPFCSEKPTQIRSPRFELARVLVRRDHIASRIVNASLRGFGHASKAWMHHEQYGRSVKARLQRQRRETAMLVERAHSLMRESRKLLEQREAQLKQQEQFLKQRATLAHEMI